MSSAANKPPDSGKDDFAAQAELSQPGMLTEMWAFLRYNKKWWLTPIIVVILLVGMLVILSATAAGPFIYTLF